MLAATALLVAGLGAIAFWQAQPHGTRDVAMPPDDASPEEVVAAYTDALDAHDCDTAEAIVLEGRQKSVDNWCDDLASLEDVRVEQHRPQPRRVTLSE